MSLSLRLSPERSSNGDVSYLSFVKILTGELMRKIAAARNLFTNN